MIDLFEVLPACFPDSLYMWVGTPTNQEELDECLTWMSEDPKPTWEELETAWAGELASREQAELSKIANRESAMAKLALLGLTEEEARAVIGL